MEDSMQEQENLRITQGRQKILWFCLKKLTNVNFPMKKKKTLLNDTRKKRSNNSVTQS